MTGSTSRSERCGRARRSKEDRGGRLGQQRRIAVIFHASDYADGYSVDLDQFHGLDQIGEEGLKDRVNNHYLQIFALRSL